MWSDLARHKAAPTCNFSLLILKRQWEKIVSHATCERKTCLVTDKMFVLCLIPILLRMSKLCCNTNAKKSFRQKIWISNHHPLVAQPYRANKETLNTLRFFDKNENAFNEFRKRKITFVKVKKRNFKIKFQNPLFSVKLNFIVHNSALNASFQFLSIILKNSFKCTNTFLYL